MQQPPVVALRKPRITAAARCWSPNRSSSPITGRTIQTIAMMRLSLNALPKVEITSTRSIPPSSPVTIAARGHDQHRIELQREAEDDQRDSEQRPVVHSLRSEAAAARRLDDEAVARLHLRRSGRASTPRSLPSTRSTQLRPGSASPPPASPARRDPPPVGEDVGAHRLEEASSRGPRRRRPCARPSPPDPRRIANASSRTGSRVSRISGSVSRLLVMCVCTALGPVMVGPRARSAGDRLIILVARRCRR